MHEKQDESIGNHHLNCPLGTLLPCKNPLQPLLLQIQWLKLHSDRPNACLSMVRVDPTSLFGVKR